MTRLRIALAATSIIALSFWIGASLHRVTQSPPSTTPSDVVEAALPNPEPQIVETPEFSTIDEESAPNPMGESNPSIPNELLIAFADLDSFHAFAALAAANDIRILDRSETLLSFRLAYEGQQAIERIGNLAGEDAEIDPNYIVVTPTFPEMPSNTGTRSFENRALEWIGVTQDNRSWGQGVTIAILDTGILDHPTLSEASVSQIRMIEETEGASQDPYSSHGTSVASLIAGEGIGIAPSSSLIGIQVIEDNGTGDSFTLAAGIVEAVDRGASVISMSLGSYGSSAALQKAVNYALENDVALIASAGNDSLGSLTYPARYEGVIGVTAVDSESQPAYFSNFGSAADIAAPGVDLLAAWEQDQWASFSGTSASAPLVAGSIAALLSIESRLTPNAAANLILEYANDAGLPGPDPYLGSGALNIERVLQRNETGIADAALADIYLDVSDGESNALPLLVNVENRGTELLNSVSISLQENDGFAQRIYLGSIPSNQTVTHTLYLSEAQLESGYSIQAETILGNQSDDRTGNDALVRQMRILPANDRR